MCFTRKPYDKVRANIAKEDIFAYKWLQPAGKKWRNIMSPYRGFPWKEGEIYVEKSFEKELEEDRFIDVGFHSLRSTTHAYQYRTLSLPEDCKLYKVCIPKGSYYYINDSQIVSNKCYLVSSTPVRGKKL